MDVSIILNPAAGKGRGVERFVSLGELPAGWRAAEAQRTRGAGDATELASRAVERECGLLVVAGGDGTVHEAINGLMEHPRDRRPVVAHLPVGTGCDFARALGLSDARGRLAGEPARWRPRRVDVGEVVLPGGRSRWFVNAANVGLGPRVARWVAHRGWRSAGRMVYEIAAAVAILTTRPRALRIVTAEDTQEHPTFNLSICNGRYFGAGMQPCPDARLDDGRLDAAWVGDIGRLAALVRLPGLMRGRLRAHPRLRRFTATELRVEGTGGVEADGEIVGDLPVIFRVRPGALRVLAPPVEQGPGNATPTTD